MDERADFDQRILILGWDGATWDLLRPWAEAGELPALARVMGEGCWGRMRTVIPPGTGPAWSSMVTGKNPGKHGVFEFMERREASYRIGPLDGSALRAETIWERVGGAGGEIVALNVPMTYPPRPVAGTLVSGILTPRSARTYTHPPEFAAALESREPGYAVMPTEVYAPGRVKEFLTHLHEVLEHKRRVLLWLMREKPWRFLMQVFNETDVIQHGLWHVMDPSHPNYNAAEASDHGHAILDLYRKMDSILDDILSALPENTTLMLVSDHGAGPLRRFLHTNLWLMERGFLQIRHRPISRLKHRLFRWGLTPMNLYNTTSKVGLGRVKTKLRWTAKGYAVLRSLFLSFGDVDWENTLAYGLGGGWAGGIYLNVKGREPLGRIEPGDAYERERRRIADDLRGVPDPATGAPLVSKVWFREELFSGPFASESPDLYFSPSDESCAVFGDFEFSSNRVLEPTSPAISGQHRMDGVLGVWGPHIRRGEILEGVRIVDVAPTALHLMGMAVPEGMDGRVLNEALTPEFLGKREVRTVREDASDSSAGGPRYSDREEGEIIDRLKGLGYIS